MKAKFSEVNLASFAGGAANELFQRELTGVLSNLRDVNTKHNTKRKITLTFTFEADEARETCAATVRCEAKLAPVKTVAITTHISEGSKGETVLVQKREDAANVVALNEKTV